MTFLRTVRPLSGLLLLLFLAVSESFAANVTFEFNESLNSDSGDFVSANLSYKRDEDRAGQLYSSFVNDTPDFVSDADDSAIQLAWDDYLSFSPNLLENIDVTQPFRFNLRFKASTEGSIINSSPCCASTLSRLLLNTNTGDQRDLGMAVYLDALGDSNSKELTLFINIGDGRSFLTSDPQGQSEGYRFTAGSVLLNQWYDLIVEVNLQNAGKEKLIVNFDGARYTFALDDPNRLDISALKQHFQGRRVGMPPFSVYAEFCQIFECYEQGLGLPEGMSAPQLFLGGFPDLDPHNATIDVAVSTFTLASPILESSAETLNGILELFIAHIQGTASQTDETLEQAYSDFSLGFSSDWDSIRSRALKFLDAYSVAYPALFVNESLRSPATFSVEGKLVYFLQQWLLDNQFQKSFDLADSGIVFEDSEHWPGPVSETAQRVSAFVDVDASYQTNPAILLNQQGTVIRPTGFYAPPGEIVTITVPPAAVTNSLKLRIGIHRADMEAGGYVEFNRFPRISSIYDISQETFTVANPFGGGLYFEVADGTDLGAIQVLIEGAVAMPMYSILELNGHSDDQAAFNAAIDTWPVPWFELHGKHFSATLPMNEAKLYSDAASLLQLMDDGFEDIRLMAGRPLAGIRAEWLAYDRWVTVYGTALTASYPIYPNQDLGERDIFLSAPSNFASPIRLMNPDFFSVTVDTATTRASDWYIYVLFHEWGHLHNLPTLNFQEQESNVHLLASVFYNKTMGADIDTALQYSGFQFFDRDRAALDTMFSPNWQLGKRLSEGDQIYGIWDNEVRYQTRSWARIVEIAALFGWEAVGDIHRAFYERGQSLGSPVNYGLQDDDFVETASDALGLNLGPIFEFWGVPPSPAAKQRLQSLPVPPEFEARLLHYASIAPRTQADFQTIYETHSKLHSPTSEVMIRMNWYRDNFDAEMSNVILSRVTSILDEYYPSDSDGDGFKDYDDIFPQDASESLDSDGDGIGNNADTDDDGDGIPDVSETAFGTDPFVDDAAQDKDGDGVSNYEEYVAGTSARNPLDPTPLRESAQADFSGDNKADVLVRSTGGSWWLYTMNGGTVSSQGRIPATGSTDWEPQSFADFNGDGKADILIRHKELGIWWLYIMDGNKIVKSERVLATRDLNFQPLSFKDTNNDGNADVLLRHSDGRWWRYGMSGATILSNSAVGATRNTEFEPVSYEDFNGDGNADILVRNKSNGIWYLYQLNGETVVAAGTVSANRDLNWEPESTADFNGDGIADLLVRNKETKAWWLYTLNGNSVGTSSSLKASNDATWHPVGTEDFDGDGNADLLLRSEKGSWWLYTLSGSTVLTEGRLAITGSLDWRPVSFADFNGDGKADALMRNVATGSWWLYTLDGQTVLKSEKVYATPNLNWQLQP